ncbi:MAG: nucleotidyltransferase family protein [Synergistota bacterium]|nr:nucleotidyltransferase family protein [Synergistota bacterium]
MRIREPVKDKESIFEGLDRAREDLAALGVITVGLFGSFARGDQNDDSDVDLLVEFAEGKRTFDNFMELSFLLEDLMGRRVEIVTREGMSPHILPRVLEEVESYNVAS